MCADIHVLSHKTAVSALQVELVFVSAFHVGHGCEICVKPRCHAAMLQWKFRAGFLGAASVPQVVGSWAR